MIGKVRTCCTIDWTGKETLTPIREYPEVADILIYVLVYCLVVCLFYKTIEDKNNGRKQHESVTGENHDSI